MYKDIVQNGASFKKVMQNGVVIWEKQESAYNWTYGYRFGGRQGQYQEAEGYMISDFIPYEQPKDASGTYVKVYAGCESYVIMYDENYNAIDYWSNSYTFTINGKNYHGSNRVSTENAKYIRVDALISDYENAIIYNSSNGEIIFDGANHPPITN